MRLTYREPASAAGFFIASLLQILFVYAAISKLSDIEKFMTEVGQSPLLTYFVGLVVVAVPATEIAAVVLLFFPSTRIWGMYLSLLLMVSFTAYVVAIMKFAAYVPCSCGGILSDMTWHQHLVFNVIFTAIALLGVFAQEATNQSQSNHKVFLPIYLR